MSTYTVIREQQSKTTLRQVPGSVSWSGRTSPREVLQNLPTERINEKAYTLADIIGSSNSQHALKQENLPHVAVWLIILIPGNFITSQVRWKSSFLLHLGSAMWGFYKEMEETDGATFLIHCFMSYAFMYVYNAFMYVSNCFPNIFSCWERLYFIMICLLEDLSGRSWPYLYFLFSLQNILGQPLTTYVPRPTQDRASGYSFNA